MVNKDELVHLASLSRIQLAESEIAPLQKEIEEIVDYVSVIQSLTVDFNKEPVCGPVCNVFRKDEVTNEPGEYTESLLKEAPATKNGYLQVKQILQNDEE